MPSNDMLTEDGHPIGEMVIADNSLPRPDVPNTVREEEVKDELMELTGSDTADEAFVELYEGYDDAEKRHRALRMYVVERKTFEQISKALDVPQRTVSMWAYNGRWDVTLRREINVEQEHSLLQLTRLRNDRREKAAIEQLDSAKVVRDKVLSQLAEDRVSVKSAAEALKSAADVEARILGIAESGALDRGEKSEAEKQQAAGGKTPLVAIFNSGDGLPPIKIVSQTGNKKGNNHE